MNCQQEIGITIDPPPPCVNWPDTVWGAPTIIAAGAGNGAIAASGGHAVLQANITGPLADSWSATQPLSVVANGFLCNCKVTIVWNWANAIVGTCAGIVNLYTIGQSWVFDQTIAPNTFVFPFVVNNFPHVPFTIVGDVIIQRTAPSGGAPASCYIEATFEVV